MKKTVLLFCLLSLIVGAEPEKLEPLDGVEIGQVKYFEGAGQRHEGLEKAIVRELEVPSGEKVRYLYNRVSLNGRDRHFLVMLVGGIFSGSGGGTGAIFADNGDQLDLVTRISLFRSPVIQLPSRTGGYYDLALPVAGGGAKAHYAHLRFDGQGYPSNPSTVDPVASGTRLSGTAYLATPMGPDAGLTFTAP